jgi:hypothetical protein
MNSSVWLPFKHFITSETFFAVFSLFGLLSSFAVFALAVLS